MATGCPRCGRRPEIGVLCEPCAALIPACESLMREHVSSRVIDPSGWLIDGFGIPHGLGPSKTTIGRGREADLVVLNASVSRAHAELHRLGDAWQLRDLGSRNRTLVDGRRVEGRSPLAELVQVRFGDVGFYFVGRAISLPPPVRASIATAHAATASAFRFNLRGAVTELCLVGPGGPDDRGGGALMYRPVDDPAWSETSLAPLEYQLLRTLCAKAIEEAALPTRARGCVATRELARTLPFHSGAPDEENVRQLMRRFRVTLDEIGARGLIEAVPGRGYYITWPVAQG